MGHSRVAFCLCQDEFSCETIHQEICSACAQFLLNANPTHFNKKRFSTRTHFERGTRELVNSLLKQISKLTQKIFQDTTVRTWKLNVKSVRDASEIEIIDLYVKHEALPAVEELRWLNGFFVIGWSLNAKNSSNEMKDVKRERWRSKESWVLHDDLGGTTVETFKARFLFRVIQLQK